MRLAYAITQDLPLADEVDQDSFLRVYRRINQFDDERTFSPWFNRMLYVKSPGILRPQTWLLNC